MSIEVIGAGFGRTGTMFLAALDDLGFGPCYHMSELFEHPKHIELWEAAAKGQPVDWDEVFAGYRATVDWPGGASYEELMEKYPDAKVILTVRDPERWYESAWNTIYGMHRTIDYLPISRLVQLLVPRMRAMKRAGRMINALAWEGMFHGRFEDKEYAIEAFERWNEEVKKRVAAERLLVYEVEQGWEPLCEFLGVEVPGKPFPHLNDAEVFQTRIRRMRTRSIAVPIVAVLTLSTLLAGFVLLRSRKHSRA